MAIRDGLAEIQGALDLPEPVLLSDIVRVGGAELFEQVQDEDTSTTWSDCLTEAAATVLQKLRETRQQEGLVLSAELGAKIKDISGLIHKIEQGADAVLTEFSYERQKAAASAYELPGSAPPRNGTTSKRTGGPKVVISPPTSLARVAE